MTNNMFALALAISVAALGCAAGNEDPKYLTMGAASGYPADSMTSGPSGAEDVGQDTGNGEANGGGSEDGGAQEDVPDSDDANDGIDSDDSQPPQHLPLPFGCITSVEPGTHVFTCDGLANTVTIPPKCLTAPCGIVLDVHGASMDADQQDLNTNMRALGNQHGYIVVQPTTDGFSWSAGHQDRIMTGLFAVMEAMQADADRIHVTGFSAGGGVTWVIVCEYADVFASAAPAAATGQYLGSAPNCFGTDPPNPQMDLLYVNGLLDPLEKMEYVDQMVPKILSDWALGPGMVVQGDATYERLRHQNANGTKFDLITHSYQTDQSIGIPPLGTDLVGHCYPGSTDHAPVLPGQLAGYGCKGNNSFHFGETVIEFFIDNPK